MRCFLLYTLVSVGFEYESCLNVILWEKRTATLQGYELEASSMGGWTLDKHHILDVPNGRNRLSNPTGTTTWEMSPHQFMGSVPLPGLIVINIHPNMKCGSLPHLHIIKQSLKGLIAHSDDRLNRNH